MRFQRGVRQSELLFCWSHFYSPVTLLTLTCTMVAMMKPKVSAILTTLSPEVSCTPVQELVPISTSSNVPTSSAARHRQIVLESVMSSIPITFFVSATKVPVLLFRLLHDFNTVVQLLFTMSDKARGLCWRFVTRLVPPSSGTDCGILNKVRYLKLSK